jgi:glycine/D-amino acid oxidase-like deaminating enzyme
MEAGAHVMTTAETHVVVGAGIAGCLSALHRRRAGYDVVLLERNQSLSGALPVCTETSNVVSENHSGAEYPFDAWSARDCLTGRVATEELFPDDIYAGKDYSRIIASQSMIDDGIDIRSICRRNMDVLRAHYDKLRDDDPGLVSLREGEPLVEERADLDGVADVAGVFVTPQRGLNPTYVAAVLEHELVRAGVDFRSGCDLVNIARNGRGGYSVEYRDPDGETHRLAAAQVSLCAAAHSYGIAKRLNPRATFPPRIFLALREILYVSLPDGTDKDFTCLKLEDRYGGMLSPLNDECAMAYHPPAAHICTLTLDPATGEYPAEYARYLATGHPEQEERAEWTMRELRRYYPELQRSEILGIYLKVAVNTVDDSRVRRHLDVRQILPGCTMTVLPKWTMCVQNVRQEMNHVLERSVELGTIDDAGARERREALRRYHLDGTWDDVDALERSAERHAVNMSVPVEVAQPMRGALLVR